MAREFPDLAVLAAANSAGEIFCTSSQQPPTGVAIADRAYFQAALRGEAPVVSDLITGRATGRKVLVVAHPVVDAAGNVQTVMTLSLAPERIARLLSDVPRPEEATIRVLDRVGHVVAHVPHGPELIGQTAEGTLPPDLFTRPKGVAVRQDSAGSARLYGFAHPEDTPNLVAEVAVPPDAVFAETERLFARQMVVTRAAFLLAALAAFWLGRFAILTLHELATNAAKYGTLSTDAGSAELSGRLEPASGAGPLVIEWAERGAHPRAAGFWSLAHRAQRSL